MISLISSFGVHCFKSSTVYRKIFPIKVAKSKYKKSNIDDEIIEINVSIKPRNIKSNLSPVNDSNFSYDDILYFLDDLEHDTTNKKSLLYLIQYSKKSNIQIPHDSNLLFVVYRNMLGVSFRTDHPDNKLILEKAMHELSFIINDFQNSITLTRKLILLDILLQYLANFFEDIDSYYKYSEISVNLFNLLISFEELGHKLLNENILDKFTHLLLIQISGRFLRF
jgi:hypothetical protein